MAVQLGDSEFSKELPRYLTRFSGRESEIGVLRGLIEQDLERLVTVTGPGGVGKTRLMVEALAPYANQLGGSPVVFVDGAAVSEPGELLMALALQLDLEQLGDETVGGQLSEFLADRPMLVVLDNMEHLLGASPEVARMLQACPRLRVFVTSRAPLRISSERLVSLEPLSTTSEKGTDLSPAAALFSDRAQMARPILRTSELHGPTVDAICERLDGLPLALELAAARLRMLSLEALLALLTRQLEVLGGGAVDTAERHHTLTRAISWSYDLLSADEQWLFRRLSVFPESFSLEMAEAICVAHNPEGTHRAGALDLITTLFDHGLLQEARDHRGGKARFRMLYSIREFARDRLERSNELEPVLEQLTASVAEFVTAQSASLIGPRQSEAMEALASESAVIRLVHERAIERGDPETSLSLIGQLWRFWANRGLFQDARDLIDRSFQGRVVEPTPLWAAALRGGAVIAEIQSDWVAARKWGMESLEIWEALGDRTQMANAWIDFGNVHSSAGELDVARSSYERAEALAIEANNERLAFIANGSLANLALRQGRITDAIARYETIVPICRQSGDQWMLATLLSNFGIALVRIGDRPRATTLLQESLLIYRQIGDEAGTASALNNLDEALGDELIGSGLAREALEIALRLDAPYLIAPANLHLGVAAMRTGDLRAAGAFLSTALRNFQLADNPIFSCEAIELIAEVMEASDPAAAARLLGGTAGYRASNGIEWEGYHASRAKQLGRRLARRFGEARYAELLESGANMGLHALVIEALTLASTVAPAPGKHAQSDPALPALTARELAVLRLMAGGKTDREIGQELFISPKTANRHVANIFAKLDCHNRTAATTRAHLLGLL